MSVHIKTVLGRYGNQLCPYFFARILSEKLKFTLHNHCKEHPDFLLQEFADLPQDNYSSYDFPVQNIGNATTGGNNSHPDVDIFQLINDSTPRKIVLDGYFQKKKYFLPFKEKIYNWFNPAKYNTNENDVAVHVRIGDLRCHNLLTNLLPVDYYIQAIELCNPDRVFVCTDSPDDIIVKTINQKFNSTLFQESEKNTLSFLASHNNLILSQGSFSFWAGFFCKGRNIFNAIPRTGWNSIEHQADIDLLLTESNYKFIKL